MPSFWTKSYSTAGKARNRSQGLAVPLDLPQSKIFVSLELLPPQRLPLGPRLLGAFQSPGALAGGRTPALRPSQACRERTVSAHPWQREVAPNGEDFKRPLSFLSWSLSGRGLSPEWQHHEYAAGPGDPAWCTGAPELYERGCPASQL